jgi:peptidoglycan/LPS O-acetylase OafA/YrhL
MSRAPLPSPYAIAPAYSVYLDLLRGGSALWVALSHLHLFGVAGPHATIPLPEDGHDAVVLFFILSGFLVAHAVVRKPDQGLTGYLLDRASRIYSVALPLLVISFLCAALGFINAYPAYQLDKWYIYLPLFVTFLNQNFGFREVPLQLFPWWSLAFEVWYYVLFGCAFFLRGKTRLIVCLIVFLLLGGRLWMLMPVWLGGVIALLIPFQRWSRNTSLAIALTSVAAFILFKQSGVETYIRTITLAPWGGIQPRPFGNATYFSTDYIVTPLAVLHLVAMRRLLTIQKIPCAAAIRAFAAVSFTLYLLHPLIYSLWTEGLGRTNGGNAETLAVLALAIFAAFAVAPFTEYRRHNWRVLLAKLIGLIGLQERKITS